MGLDVRRLKVFHGTGSFRSVKEFYFFAVSYVSLQKLGRDISVALIGSYETYLVEN